MKYILETERLRLRQLTYRDSPFVIQLMNSAGWLQYIGDRNVRTHKDAIRYMEEGPIKSYRDHGFGLYLAEMKDRGTPIGMCGLLKRDALQYPDIGFAFLPEHGGKGYAVEVAEAIMQYARHDLKIVHVSAITKPDNAKSIRLLEKLGLEYVREIRLPPANEDLLLYSTDQDTA